MDLATNATASRSSTSMHNGYVGTIEPDVVGGPLNSRNRASHVASRSVTTGVNGCMSILTANRHAHVEMIVQGWEDRGLQQWSDSRKAIDVVEPNLLGASHRVDRRVPPQPIRAERTLAGIQVPLISRAGIPLMFRELWTTRPIGPELGSVMSTLGGNPVL